MDGEAWEAVRLAERDAGVEIRPLTTLDDADEIVRIMVATWGRHQLLPRELIRAFQGSGNVPLGASRHGRLVGYVLGFAGVDPEDGLHVHSHMLAVEPERRHAGVGYVLKLAQRAQALESGIELVRWTFDPLQARNAHFNIGKLGVIADRFHRDYYGEMSDVLNRGDRSDRLEARWDLRRRPGARPVPPGPERLVLRADGDPDLPRPLLQAEPEVATEGTWRVELPREYPGLKERDPDLARAWREAVGAALDACFARGMRAVSFDRDAPAYALALPEAAVGGSES